MGITNKLANSVKLFRKEHKMTQADLAKIVFGDPQKRDKICMIENSYSPKNSKNIDLFCDRLDLMIEITPMITEKQVYMTDAFDGIPKNVQHMFTIYENREILTRALIDYKNTGHFPVQLSPHNKAILEEILKSKKPFK